MMSGTLFDPGAGGGGGGWTAGRSTSTVWESSRAFTVTECGHVTLMSSVLSKDDRSMCKVRKT